jgi:serine/threonine protein kinase
VAANSVIQSRQRVQLIRSKYHVLGSIGRGQFGRVLCAIRHSTGQLLALKELDPERFATAKFLRELRFLVALHHPNVISWQGYDHFQEGRYLAMDYCEGGNLRQLLEQYEQSSLGRLPIELSLNIMTDVMKGLAHIHDRSIIHADLKPENILLSLSPAGWQAKISDFGIACSSHENTGAIDSMNGSPAYMAPERFANEISGSADIYSAGVILYELLLGERPFSGSLQTLMRAHLSHPLHLPSTLPPMLRTILQRALSKSTEHRFANAEAMGLALQQAQAQLLRSELTQPLRLVDETVILADSDVVYAQPSISVTTVAHRIERLIPRPTGCFIQTQQGLHACSKSGLSLLRPVPTHGFIDVTPCGQRLVSLSPTNQPHCYRWQLFDRQTQQLLLQQTWKLANIPLNFLALNRRLALLMFRQYCQKRQMNITAWSLHDRQGKCLTRYEIPLDLKFVTATANPDELLAIEAGAIPAFLVIQLKPLKFRRIPLSFMPSQVIKTHFGFVALDKSGTVFCLNPIGQVMGTMPLQGLKTAIGMAGDTLLVGAYVNQSPQLMSLNLAAVLQKSQSCKNPSDRRSGPTEITPEC